MRQADSYDPRLLRRSFDAVDGKLLEASYFLEMLFQEPRSPVEAGFVFSAFLSASRSVTFAMQAVVKAAPEFTDWYEQQQRALREDAISRWFVAARNVSEKQGSTPIEGGTFGGDRISYWFGASVGREPPECDVETACRHYMRLLTAVVYACYEEFGPLIDPMEYYRPDNFARIGRTLEDAEEDIIGVRGWTDGAGLTDEDRWLLVRRALGHAPLLHDLWDLFDRYQVGGDEPPRPWLR